MKTSNRIIFLLTAGLVALLFWQSMDDPFFWDGVQLGAKQAWFFYEHDFQYFWLPAEIDSGHPPFFGMYLAACWKLLGAHLRASHLAMLPFLMLFFYTAWQLGRYYLGAEFAFVLLLLYLADPTVLSQLLLIGPDAALLAFFLLAFLGYSQNNKILQALGVLGLGLISMRGMMCAFALFLFEFIGYWRAGKWDRQWWWQRIKVYGPGVLLAILFLGFHFRAKNWIGYHPASPWALSFQKNNAEEAFRHIFILIWRMLDFGRIFLWLPLLYLAIKSSNWKEWPRSTWLAGLLFLVLAWPFIYYQGLNQHRYLLPFYLVLHLVFLQKWQSLPWEPWKKYGLLSLLVLGLVSGHSWIYPPAVAQGWDSSLAYRPYFSLRAEAEKYLKQKAIPLDSVGTAFPAIGPLRNYDPSSSGTGFANKNTKAYPYYFITNIMNGYTEEELDQIEKNYQRLFYQQERGIYVSIYGKKEKKSGRIE